VPLRSEIKQLITERGDHSFAGLLIHSGKIKHALELQHQAWVSWNQCAYNEAIKIYQETAKQLFSEGCITEGIFNLYYISEIYAEQEAFRESIKWITKAISKLPEPDCPFLSGLLFESYGYSQWYLDHLPGSAIAFSTARKHWQQIGFDQGIINSWINLGSVFLELGIEERAEDCFNRTLQLLGNREAEEIRFRIYAHLALFHHRRYDTAKAQEFLERWSHYRHVDPSSYWLGYAEITSEAEYLKKIDAEHYSIRIESQIVLGRIYQDTGQMDAAEPSYREALRLSRQYEVPFWTRKSILLLGELLEEKGEYEEALSLYKTGFNNEEIIYSVDSLFPFWRAISPLFDGWIRCLIALNREDTAQSLIQSYSLLRQKKAEHLLNTKSFSQSRLLNTSTFSDQSIDYEQSKVPSDLAVMELWPDRNCIHIWLNKGGQRSFYTVKLTRSISKLIDGLVRPLYESKSILPPDPSPELLSTLFSVLMGDLINKLPSDRLLLIPHKILQSLPFEMLLCDNGQWLFERLSLSYLPSLNVSLRHADHGDAEPALLISNQLANRFGHDQEKKFFSTRPGVRVFQELDLKQPLRAHWIHLATHFHLNPRSWLDSEFHNGRGTSNISHLLRTGVQCDLITLAMCESANGFWPDLPYWFGFAELFLVRGANSLVASRWALDEISSTIFLDFYRGWFSGLAPDQSLRRARQQFLKKNFEREGLSVPTRHPYFWAGISYIGWPDQRISKPQRQRYQAALSVIPLISSLLLYCALMGITKNNG
jgi:CHAT domain-containing protein